MAGNVKSVVYAKGYRSFPLFCFCASLGLKSTSLGEAPVIRKRYLSSSNFLKPSVRNAHIRQNKYIVMPVLALSFLPRFPDDPNQSRGTSIHASTPRPLLVL